MNWRRQHKWSGIAATLLLVMMCLSGLVLNHPDLVADLSVSRRWLPVWYQFHDWRGGLARGSLSLGDSLLIYGSNGVWLTDTAGHTAADFAAGLPTAPAHRRVRSVVSRSDGLWMVTPEGVWHRAAGDTLWREASPELPAGDRFTDLTTRGDTLVAVSRSHVFLSEAPGAPWRRVSLPQAQGRERSVSLFRSVWMLHSGTIFGAPGVAVVDAVSVVLIILAVTGMIIWIGGASLRRRARRHLPMAKWARTLRPAMRLHVWLGAVTLTLTMLICFTGWCLRPPLMIPLALTRTAPLPGSTLASPNPWHDDLRMMRYDPADGAWLLSASDGFYRMDSIGATPERIAPAPPVSVMGLTVWHPLDDDSWLCGSFAGLYRWHRPTGRVTDVFTGQPAPTTPGPPVGAHVIAGYLPSLSTPVDYYSGVMAPLTVSAHATQGLNQPARLTYLPMSMADLALEAHSGRLLLGSLATLSFIPLAGLLILWCLLSGHLSRRHSRPPKR